MTDWLSAAQLKATTKRQFVFINVARLIKKYIRENMKNAYERKK